MPKFIITPAGEKIPAHFARKAGTAGSVADLLAQNEELAARIRALEKKAAKGGKAADPADPAPAA